MIKLYHAPMTRSIRIMWLLEELGVPYQLERVRFEPPKTPFAQRAPFGKLPAIEEDGTTMIESGAIIEYLLERHGAGRLAPAPGSPLRGQYLQWLHFAEATAFPPLGEIVRHTIFKPEAERIPAVVADARERAGVTFAVVDRALEGKEFLVGDEFSAADVMMGFTLLVAERFGLLGAATPNLNAYVARLKARPALQKALA